MWRHRARFTFSKQARTEYEIVSIIQNWIDQFTQAMNMVTVVRVDERDDVGREFIVVNHAVDFCEALQACGSIASLRFIRDGCSKLLPDL